MDVSNISPSATFGPLLVALFVAIWLSSSCVHLNLSYFRTTHDSWQWKLAVSFLTFASTAHTGILSWALYEHLILHWGETEFLAFSSHIIFLVVIGFIVQMYFAFRLSSLYKEPIRSWLVSSVAVFAAAQLAFGIVAAYNNFRNPFPLFAMDVHEKLGWQTLSYLVFAVVCNLEIFVANFYDARSSRFAVRAETILEVVSRMIVETNLLATVASILSLAFLLVWNNAGRESGMWMAFALVLPKLYVFSLLASHTRGAELVRITVDYSKHESSLSDMFKGSPVSQKKVRFPITLSKIGEPRPQADSTSTGKTPIADRFAGSSAGTISPESPGWLRRTIQSPQPVPSSNQQLAPPTRPSPLARQSSAAVSSISDYGEYFADDNEPVPRLPQQHSHNNEAFSTSIEVSLSPRRTSFNQNQRMESFPVTVSSSKESEGEVVPISSVMGLNLGRPPVTYGYL
ncbi:DUF6534 domain-containing protein [Sporobolomyces salmoneus]|uniref:DUF6534 domain-containing protein n=1 Tax=Sporobolomyces salmoneus TaxID=183962 RepID=UPI0031718104